MSNVKAEDLILVRKRLADFIEIAEEIKPVSAYDKLVTLLIDLDRVITKAKKQV